MPKRGNNKNNITVILQQLGRSEVGNIFLVNLHCCLETNTLVATRVRAALGSVKSSISSSMSPANLLGHLKAVLQRKLFRLHLQINSEKAFAAFAGGGYLVTVMLYDDYDRYYADPSHRTFGHAFALKKPGEKSDRFLSTAKTNKAFWAAPVQEFPDIGLITSKAETARDVLGLAHLGTDKELIALHFIPSPAKCYRPTIVEAIPNSSRFRQTSARYPTETRWGYTVDLAKLESVSGPTDDITGVRELVFEQVLLQECTVDGFYYLDRPLTDRSTNDMESKFLVTL